MFFELRPGAIEVGDQELYVAAEEQRHKARGQGFAGFAVEPLDLPLFENALDELLEGRLFGTAGRVARLARLPLIRNEPLGTPAVIRVGHGAA